MALSPARKSWARILELLSGSRGLVALTVVGSALQAVTLLPIPLLIGHVFATEIPRSDERAIVQTGALVLALYLLSSLVALATAAAANRCAKTAVARLRYEFIARLYALPQTWHDGRKLGLVHSLLLQDTDRVDQMLMTVIAQVIPGALVCLVLSAAGLAVNALLFGVLVAVLPLLIVAGQLLGRRLRRSAKVWWAAFSDFSAETQQLLRALTLTKVSGAEATELHSRRLRLEELAQKSRRFAISGAAYSSVQASISAIAGVVVLVVGGIAVARHSMTIADLISFYAILGLIVRQLSTVAAALPVVLSGAVSLLRLDEILGADDREPYSGRRQLDFRGGITFEGVSFTYDGPEVLQAVDLTIESGDRIAVTGPNGAGKSTLVAVLLGLYRPTVGRVLADGVPFDELDLRAVRREMGVLMQDPLLFPASIRENIAYGRPEAGEAAVRLAARQAGAAVFIEALPNGYDTQVGDEGVGLSGGQRQRIAIARALLADPTLLVLDEPTTYLDDAAVDALLERLHTLPAAPSIVIVTHDVSVAEKAERVVHMRAGRIVRVQSRATETAGTAG